MFAIDRPLSAHNVLASAGVLRKLSKEESGNCAVRPYWLLSSCSITARCRKNLLTRSSTHVRLRALKAAGRHVHRWDGGPDEYPIAVIRTHLCSNEKSSFSRFDCCRDFCVRRCGWLLSASSGQDNLIAKQQLRFKEALKPWLGSFQSREGVIDVVMLGDSITAQGEWAKLFPEEKILNLGLSGDTSAGLLNRLDDVVGRKPRVVFLMIGINDFLRDIPLELVAAHIQFIASRLAELYCPSFRVLCTFRTASEKR
jgi:GDSL-like Lipase/Acylhydrolase family